MGRVVISGVQSSGKSTLLGAIKPLVGEMPIYEEIVRSMVKRGVKINKDADHESQCLILKEHYRNSLLNGEFISDRGAIDAFVYATWSYLNGDFTYEEHKEHEAIFLSCLPMYTHHYYLPIEFEAIEDGVRDVNEAYRHELERLYYLTYHKYNIPYVELRGTVDSRRGAFWYDLMNSIVQK